MTNATADTAGAPPRPAAARRIAEAAADRVPLTVAATVAAMEEAVIGLHLVEAIPEEVGAGPLRPGIDRLVLALRECYGWPLLYLNRKETLVSTLKLPLRVVRQFVKPSTLE